MTTAAALVHDVETSPILPSLFNIRYPNCRTGMFSLREPFQNVRTEFFPIENRQLSTEKLTESNQQPTDFNYNQVSHIREKTVESLSRPSQKISKRNAEVQCSLLKPYISHEVAVQTKCPRQQIPENALSNNNDEDVNSRYRRQTKLQTVKQRQQIYEIRDIESPPLRTIPINQRIKRKEQHKTYTKARKSIKDYDDDNYDDEDEFNDDDDDDDDSDNERIIYARERPHTIRKTYLPSNVRMICVREDIK
ncbi:unnamed protein product [Rotaria magnacalcarata]|uniref:Uncharacterized protein n=2 Tax=Rotaria magnacalcarata TaxID=392030 RepID=A0A816W2P3_9BILA|nr:unnamed protein product [Rotaria magnacalcarata]CAF2138624.1 unnamed protein product [Rotaria magnacalcarata]CAF2221493.1 unnamed protein product [Rotaria magnacalcarata]CAF3865343.1 unnamed protein product [Rotaria magnacalcarata]CAF3888964.1 unnamed protein product [Rotaria magnacalcarata]